MNGLHALEIEKHRVWHWSVVFPRIIIIILQFYPINSRISWSFLIARFNGEMKKLLTSFIGYPHLFWLVNPDYFFELLKYIKCASR